MDMKATLKEYIVNDLLNNPEMALANDAALVESGLINSIGLLQLVAFLEEEFELEIPFEDVTIVNFADIDAISDYLGTLRAAA